MLIVDSQIVRLLGVIFPKSLIGTTMQDGGKRERRVVLFFSFILFYFFDLFFIWNLRLGFSVTLHVTVTHQS